MIIPVISFGTGCIAYEIGYCSEGVICGTTSYAQSTVVYYPSSRPSETITYVQSVVRPVVYVEEPRMAYFGISTSPILPSPLPPPPPHSRRFGFRLYSTTPPPPLPHHRPNPHHYPTYRSLPPPPHHHSQPAHRSPALPRQGKPGPRR